MHKNALSQWFRTVPSSITVIFHQKNDKIIIFKFAELSFHGELINSFFKYKRENVKKDEASCKTNRIDNIQQQ